MENFSVKFAHLLGGIIAGIIASVISFSVIAIKYNRKDVARVAIICCVITGIIGGLVKAILVSIGFIFLTLYLTKKQSE